MPGRERQRWIVVRNWERFQHYSTRVPPWIKVYTELLHDEAFLGLTPNRRALLLGLWLEYASSRRAIPEDTASISSRLRQRVVSADLEALAHAGFIAFRASKTLARRYPRAEAEESRGLKAGRSKGTRARAKGLPIDIEHELERITPLLSDVDGGSAKVLEQAAAGLPLASVAKVRESVERNGSRVGVGYVVNALRSERDELERGGAA